MVAGAIAIRHRSPGGDATDRAVPHLSTVAGEWTSGAAGNRATSHPLVTRQEFEDCDRVWPMAVAPFGDRRHSPFQERLWDDHK